MVLRATVNDYRPIPGGVWLSEVRDIARKIVKIGKERAEEAAYILALLVDLENEYVDKSPMYAAVFGPDSGLQFGVVVYLYIKRWPGLCFSLIGAELQQPLSPNEALARGAKLNCGYCTCLQAERQFHFASELYFEALALDPTNPLALYEVGRLYHIGGKGRPRDKNLAFEYLTASARLGNTKAQQLCCHYHLGPRALRPSLIYGIEYGARCGDSAVFLTFIERFMKTFDGSRKKDLYISFLLGRVCVYFLYDTPAWRRLKRNTQKYLENCCSFYLDRIRLYKQSLFCFLWICKNHLIMNKDVALVIAKNIWKHRNGINYVYL
jgi:hypothetical protein